MTSTGLRYGYRDVPVETSSKLATWTPSAEDLLAANYSTVLSTNLLEPFQFFLVKN
jgi:hypothetical protein